MAFTITQSKSSPDKDILHLTASGQATAVEFRADARNPFDALLGPDWSTHLVLLNMENVSYFDSSAIGWLLSSQRDFKTNGGLLVLYSLTPNIRNILDLLKIGRIIPVAADAAAGRTLLLNHAKPVHA